MPRNKRTSFLTRQEEQQRRAKADRKREERRARQKARGTGEAGEESAAPKAEDSAE